MAAHNKGTSHYSPSDASRSAPRPDRPLGTPRFPSTTIDGELLAAFRAEAERSGLSLSAALDDAVRTWLAARAGR